MPMQIPANIEMDETSLEYFRSVEKFADRTGQSVQFEQAIQRLSNFCFEGCIVVLYSDFAKESFYFCIFEKDLPANQRNLDTRIMNGGLIYHGPLEDGTHDQTFTVQLVPSTENNWSIHT